MRGRGDGGGGACADGEVVGLHAVAEDHAVAGHVGFDVQGAVARTKWDAPEVDGALFIDSEDATKLKAGDIVRVEIDEADETDLWGTLVG